MGQGWGSASEKSTTVGRDYNVTLDACLEKILVLLESNRGEVPVKFLKAPRGQNLGKLCRRLESACVPTHTRHSIDKSRDEPDRVNAFDPHLLSL